MTSQVPFLRSVFYQQIFALHLTTLSFAKVFKGGKKIVACKLIIMIIIFSFKIEVTVSRQTEFQSIFQSRYLINNIQEHYVSYHTELRFATTPVTVFLSNRVLRGKIVKVYKVAV
jgi:hypothetical protein